MDEPERSWSTAEQAWSSAGAALEPSAEPLALLTTSQPAGQHRSEPPDQRRYAPGLDDDTPVSGTAALEPPPLWREAARHAPATGPTYPPPAESILRPPPPPEPELPEPEPAGLPQRVPAEPELPDVPDGGPGGLRERWTAPELAWIADRLRSDDVPQEPPEQLDVDAVVAAVREVPGVRSATVRPSPNGVHTLRLDLADEADPGQVSRIVAGLLEERMGLSAAPRQVPRARHAPEEPVAPAAAQPPAPAAPTTRTAPAPLAYPPLPPPEPATAATGRSVFERPDQAAGRPSFEPSRPGPRPAPGTRPTTGTETGATTEVEPEQIEQPPPEADQVEQPPPEAEQVEQAPPEAVSRPLPAPYPGPRVVIDEVRVSTLGMEATVEVQLLSGDRRGHGMATGPSVDSYVERLAAVAAARAIDQLLRQTQPWDVLAEDGPSRCFVEHTGLVAFGSTEVAVVVLLLVCGGWVEQLTGSALVDTDPRHAMVRATLGAVNRRLEALLG